jgi:hypothetical protein
MTHYLTKKKKKADVEVELENTGEFCIRAVQN